MHLGLQRRLLREDSERQHDVTLASKRSDGIAERRHRLFDSVCQRLGGRIHAGLLRWLLARRLDGCIGASDRGTDRGRRGQVRRQRAQGFCDVVQHRRFLRPFVSIFRFPRLHSVRYRCLPRRRRDGNVLSAGAQTETQSYITDDKMK